MLCSDLDDLLSSSSSSSSSLSKSLRFVVAFASAATSLWATALHPPLDMGETGGDASSGSGEPIARGDRNLAGGGCVCSVRKNDVGDDVSFGSGGVDGGFHKAVFLIQDPTFAVFSFSASARRNGDDCGRR